MPLVIDTYNVLHTVGVLPPELAGLDIGGLGRLLSGSRYRQEKATLVCDGLPTGPLPPLQPPLTVRFAGRDRTADDLIGQIVRASSAPRRLMVVSSDHAVQRTARKRRCKVLTSQEFLQQLADDAVTVGNLARSSTARQRPHGMSAEQVDHWVRIFDIDEKTASIPSRGKSSVAPRSGSGNAHQVSDGPQVNAEAAPPVRQIPELRPGQEVPENLIEQAERIWNQSQPNSSPGNNRED
jgi:hypothetical protein